MNDKVMTDEWEFEKLNNKVKDQEMLIKELQSRVRMLEFNVPNYHGMTSKFLNEKRICSNFLEPKLKEKKVSEYGYNET